MLPGDAVAHQAGQHFVCEAVREHDRFGGTERRPLGRTI
jgi:hypothetical protein